VRTFADLRQHPDSERRTRAPEPPPRVPISNHALARVLARVKWPFGTKEEYTIPPTVFGARWDGRAFYFLFERGSSPSDLVAAMAARHNLTGIHLHLVAERLVVTLTRRGDGIGEQTAHWVYVPSGDTFVCIEPSKGEIAREPGIDALQRFFVRAFCAGAKTPTGTQMTFVSDSFDDMQLRYLGIQPAPKPAAAEEKKRKAEEPEEEKKSKEEKHELLTATEANKVLNKFKLPSSGLMQLDLNEQSWKKLTNKEKLPYLLKLVGKFSDALAEAAAAAGVTKTVTLTALVAALEAKK
jgi:hypothetical protein